MTPSVNSERRKPSGIAAFTAPSIAVKPSSIQPIGASDQLNTAWNMMNSSATSSTGPTSG